MNTMFTPQRNVARVSLNSMNQTGQNALSTITPSGAMPTSGGLTPAGKESLLRVWDYINRESALQKLSEIEAEKRMFQAGFLSGPPQSANKELYTQLIDETAVEAPMLGGTVKGVYRTLKDGGVAIEDFDKIPWGKVNKYMKQRGYDYRGPDDARMLFEKYGGDTFRGEQAEAIKSTVSGKKDLFLNKVSKKRDSYISKAKEYFGTTWNPDEAGYLLHDGSMLDFSGKKFGGEGGMRNMDHREINSVYDAVGDSHSAAMFEFAADTGAIRMSKTREGVLSLDLYAKPTKTQLEEIGQMITRDTEVFIDITNKNGNVVASGEGVGIKAKRVLNKLIKENY